MCPTIYQLRRASFGMSASVGVASTTSTALADELPAGLVFASEWNTSTGMSDAAVLDTGRTRPWAAKGAAGTFEVFNTAAQSRDFPTTNFLRIGITSDNGGQLWTPYDVPYWSAPAVGGKVFARWYERVTTTFEGVDGSHPHYFQGSTPTYVEAPTGTGMGDPRPAGGGGDGWTATTFEFSVGISGGIADTNYRIWGSVTLDKNVTYRIELMYHRTGTTTFKSDIRIYDIGGTLLFDGTNFENDNPSPTTNLQAYEFTQAASGGWSAAGADEMISWRMGTEGLTGAGSGAVHELAAPAVCAGDEADWPGVYRAVEAGFTAP